MKTFNINKNHLQALLISLGVFVLLTLFMSFTTIFDNMENSAVDFRFIMREPFKETKKLSEKVTKLRKNPKARDDIVIVAIDEETIITMNQDFGIRWPFPWDLHKVITNYIAGDNPVAIFFDIMFIDTFDEKLFTNYKGVNSVNMGSFQSLPYNDMKSVYNRVFYHWFAAQEKEFAKVMKKADCVFLDYPFEVEESIIKYKDIDERVNILSQTAFPVTETDIPQGDCAEQKGRDPRCPWVREVTPPTPQLIKAARGVGYANVRPDPDSINRKLPLVIKYRNKDKYYYYPSIDLVLVMKYYGITKKDVEIAMGKYVKLKNLDPKKMKKPNSAGEIKIPIDKEGFMDINFVGGPGSFTVKSYHYFNRDPEKRGNFKDKIALIAAYSVTGISSDVHKSPFGVTFGVEHHANALNTILNQDFIVKLSAFQNTLVLLFLSLLLGLVLPRLTMIKSMIATMIFALAYIIGTIILFDSMNFICVFVVPLIQIGGTFSLITAYKVLTEQKEKKYIRQTFSKFVSKSVVDELLNDPEKLKLGGDKKILTVLFSDIRGFTSISEAMTPEALVDHLNQYLQAMTDIVFEYNGTLDKYVGDEIMAFWGAPIPQDDHAILACKAAVKMMDELHKLNSKWTAMGKPKLDIGIGLNTGEMVVGNMGSSSRMDYTLMGDMVNLGARLEGTNKVYRTNIIISEYTYEHVKDAIIARELDLIKVKGKELPVKIYELVDIK